MIKSLVFHIPETSNEKEKIVYDLNLDLKKILSNDRTTIYQNNNMRLSVDEKHIRVLLFDESNTSLLEKLREYFYGYEYKRI